MKLPDSADAWIDPRKINEYLLSSAQAVGRFKAGFLVALGFAPGEWQALEYALREQALTSDVAQEIPSASGRKYIVRGEMRGPPAARHGSRRCGSCGMAKTPRAS